MYLYFGKDGKLKTKINHDAPPRQGGDLNVTVCLDMDFWDDKERWGVDGDKYWVKTARIKSASGVLGYPQIATEGQVEVFSKLYNSEIVYDLVPGASYLMYKFRFSAEEVTKIPGQINFELSMQNLSFSDNKYVRIGIESEFGTAFIPRNGENCISRDLDAVTGKISNVVYKKGNGIDTFSNLSSVSEAKYQVGTYQERIKKSLTNNDEGFVFVQQDASDRYTYGEVSIWMWAKATGAATTCEWIQLPQYSTTDIIPDDGTFAFGVTDITIERTVGYARALIDKEIGIKYQDIMDEFKRVYSKIAIAGTKPDWNVGENTSPAYIYNKPNIKTVLVGNTKSIRETGVYIVKNDTNVKYPILGDYVLFHYSDSQDNHIQLVFENQNITWFRSLPSGGKDFGPWKSREIREVLHDGGAPDSATPGIVGQFYVDSSSQYLYYCASTTDGYEWKQLVNLTYFNSEKKSITEQINALKNADEAINGQIVNLEASINNLSSDITTITSGLNEKFDKTGGTISGDVTVTGIVLSNEGISTKANISADGPIEGKDLRVHNNAVITGNATIGGSLTVQGAVTSVETTNVNIKDQLFEIAKRDKGNVGLTSPAGFYVANYDGQGKNLAIVFDKTGTAYVGDVAIGENGLISDTSNLQPFATRQKTEIQDKSILQWDQQSTSLKDSGKTIDDFIEKQENNTGYNCLYGQDVNNNVELVRMSQNKDQNTVPLRTERGTLKGVNAEENDEFVTLQQLNDSESKLSEQVDFLEDKINETIAVNPGKTYILIIGDSVTFTVRNDGVYSVDMGDGTIYANISNVTKTHNYTRKGSAHIITVSGVGTNGDFGFSLGEDQNLAFRSIHFGEGIKKITNFLVSTPVDVCVLPETITDVLSDNFTDGNATLKYAKSVYCLSETPFTISKNVFANSLRIFVKRDSLDQYKQAWYQHLPASIIVSEVDSSDLVNEIVQTTGQSTTAVMSQKATTDEIAALKDDLAEVTDTQKRLVFGGNISGTALVQKTVNIPSGIYMFHTDGVVSSDIDSTKSYVNFYGSSGIILTLSIDRNIRFRQQINLPSNCVSIAFYASNNYSNSVGDTFSFDKVKITSDTNLGKKLDSLLRDILFNSWVHSNESNSYVSYNVYSRLHHYPNKRVRIVTNSGYRVAYHTFSDKTMTTKTKDSGWLSQDISFTMTDEYYQFLLRKDDYSTITCEEGCNCVAFIENELLDLNVIRKECVNIVDFYPVFFVPSKTNIVMHRGANLEAPENTLPAFEIAGQNERVFGIECDVRCSSDGQYIIMHDETVDRMTDGAGSVYDFTFEEIRALTVKSGSNVDNYPDLKIPTLEEYLMICRKYGKIAFMELEPNSNNPKTYISDIINLVKKCGMERSCVFMSFYDYSDEIYLYTKVIPFFLLLNGSSTSIYQKYKTISKGNIVGISIEDTNTELDTELISSVHTANGFVGVWCPNINTTYDRYANMGVDIVITDYLP